MISRRELPRATLAASAIFGASGVGNWPRQGAQQALSRDGLRAFPGLGNVTQIDITGLHAQLRPIWVREPEINPGVGAPDGLPPHLSGADLLKLFDIRPGATEVHALIYSNSTALARAYCGRGQRDRVATVVKAIRAERPEGLSLDGGDRVRVGGMGCRIDISRPQGQRIAEMPRLGDATPIHPGRSYAMAGWTSVNPETEGSAIRDLVGTHIARQDTVRIDPDSAVRAAGASWAPPRRVTGPVT